MVNHIALTIYSEQGSSGETWLHFVPYALNAEWIKDMVGDVWLGSYLNSFL